MSKRAEKAAWKVNPRLSQAENMWREVFVLGYEQAEKDLALTWEDIRAIDELLTLVYEPDNEEGYYTRVLEEFNKQKEERK